MGDLPATCREGSQGTIVTLYTHALSRKCFRYSTRHSGVASHDTTWSFRRWGRRSPFAGTLTDGTHNFVLKFGFLILPDGWYQTYALRPAAEVERYGQRGILEAVQE